MKILKTLTASSGQFGLVSASFAEVSAENDEIGVVMTVELALLAVTKDEILSFVMQ